MHFLAGSLAIWLAVVDADAVLSVVGSQSKHAHLDQFFRPPPEYTDDLGDYRSPLKFYDGSEVKAAENWQRRRREILDRWHGIMGVWPPLIQQPRIEYVKTQRRENFAQHRIRVEVASGLMRPAILLVPDGEGPFPAAVVLKPKP